MVPKLINLKSTYSLLRTPKQWLDDVLNIILKRKTVHILEGLRIALDHIDEIITTIRESDTINCDGKFTRAF